MKLAKITGAVAAAGVAMTILTAPVALAAPGETVIPAAAELAVQGEGVLPYEFQVQKTGYWCSAAAARIALTARGKKVEQSTLASYMKVTTDGLPNIKNLESALDHYTGSTYYQVKQWSSDTQLKQRLKEDVIYNANKGHAVVINVIRLNGRSYSGGHYATIVGYRAGGNEFAVADPAYAGGRLAWLSVSSVSSGIKLRRYVA
ncbi:C39 family peptidase [Lentzea aerocolonigenes]|uniref:C39 family peptidase n=1 Tax=Lentzea aerocolonigenes TaxID=68170 RepID=UPI0004C35CFE|nr:C39 family peptidase [Lentzea aerocolonigenes]MCP2249156.1 Peptidase_C39 like family protein [Lentzea aerocolonigenes]